ncbi:MAG: tetratricopeptide repeat protein [Ignavibacteriales bacterium]|nr:tetratricopeptide repeat protein [Ignavibacteriales bacterium]
MSFLRFDSDNEKELKLRRFDSILTRWVWIFILLVGINAFIPEDWNWGVNPLAFFPFPFKIIWLIHSVVFIFPRWRDNAFLWAKNFVSSFQNRLGKKSSIIVLLALLVVCWFVPVRSYFLGDGAGYLRVYGNSIQEKQNDKSEEDPFSLSKKYYHADEAYHEPLSVILNWILVFGLEVYKSSDIPLVFRIVGLIALVVFFGLLSFFFRYFFPKTEDEADIHFTKFLISGLLLCGAGSLFFFGYVENYTLFSCAMVAYLLCCWLALEDQLYFVVPGIAFALLLLLNMGSLIMIPSFFVFWILVFLKRKTEALITGVISIVLLLVGLVALDVSPMNFFLKTTSDAEGKHFLSLFSVPSRLFSYPLFSFAHCIDVLNALLLNVPFTFAIAIVFIVSFRKNIEWNNSVFIFLVSAIGCGLFFLGTINFELGMARDWDVIYVFLLPVSLFSLFLLREIWKGREKLLFSLVGISLLQLIVWVGLNHSEEKSLQRFLKLDDPFLAGVRVRQNFYYELERYYFQKKDYENQVRYLQLYMKTTPNTETAWRKVAEAYRKLGKKEEVIQSLEKVLEWNTTDPRIFLVMGVMYRELERFDEAEAFFLQSLEVDSTYTEAYNELGKMNYVLLKNYEKSAYYFTQLLIRDEENHSALQGLATSLFYLGLLDDAEVITERYLSLVPNDTLMVPFLKLIQFTKMQKGNG